MPTHHTQIATAVEKLIRALPIIIALRPIHPRRKSLVDHLRGLQELEFAPRREALGPPLDL